MTIIQGGRLTASEQGDRNRAGVFLPSDGTSLGVVQGVQSGLALTKTSGMGWSLDLGRCIIAPATAANGPVVATVTAAETGTFSAGDATRDRIDVVGLMIDETATIANGLPPVKITTIMGAYPSSGSPVVPAIPAGTIGLWGARINAGTSAGSGGWNPALLTDLRQSLRLERIKPFGHMGKANGFTSGATQTPVTGMAAQILQGGMTFSAADNALVIPYAGYYRISGRAYSSGAGTGGALYEALVDGGGGFGCSVWFTKQQVDEFHALTPVTKQFAAGNKISMRALQPASVYGGDGYNGTFLEVEYMGPVQ